MDPNTAAGCEVADDFALQRILSAWPPLLHSVRRRQDNNLLSVTIKWQLSALRPFNASWRLVLWADG